jgi:hypothetical protein
MVINKKICKHDGHFSRFLRLVHADADKGRCSLWRWRCRCTVFRSKKNRAQANSQNHSGQQQSLQPLQAFSTAGNVWLPTVRNKIGPRRAI